MGHLKTMIQSGTARNDVKAGKSRRVGWSRGLGNLLGGHFSIDFRQLSNLSLARGTVFGGKHHYRVLYQVLHDEQTIVIHQIGHRREVYRPR